jgi:hypothetical protein
MQSTVYKNKTKLSPKNSQRSGGWLEQAGTPPNKGLVSHDSKLTSLFPHVYCRNLWKRACIPNKQTNKQSSVYTNSHGAIHDNTIIICLFTAQFKIRTWPLHRQTRLINNIAGKIMQNINLIFSPDCFLELDCAVTMTHNSFVRH